MTTIILGASGKIGRFLVEKIISKELLPNTTTLILQYNTSSITYQSTPNLEIIPIKMDILSLENIKNFISQLPSNIDILINLLSIFEKTPLNTSNNSIMRTLEGNFTNQTILLKELLQKKPKTIIQFLDYSIKELYTKKYFWYSVSRSALFSFYKHLEKYTLENNQKIKIIYILPKIIDKEEHFKTLLNSIKRALSSKKTVIKKII